MQLSRGSGIPRYAVQYAAEKAGGRRRMAATAARASAMEARSAGKKALAKQKQEAAAAETARAAREAAPARLQRLVRAFQCPFGAFCAHPYSRISPRPSHAIAAPSRLHFSPSVGISAAHHYVLIASCGP